MYSLSRFQVCNTTLLTRVNILYVRSPGLIHLITESLYTLTNIFPFPHPQPLATTLLPSAFLSSPFSDSTLLARSYMFLICGISFSFFFGVSIFLLTLPLYSWVLSPFPRSAFNYFLKIFIYFIYLFFCLCWVLVVACGIFIVMHGLSSCGARAPERMGSVICGMQPL